MVDLPDYIECPPLPPLSWEDYCWIGDDHLPEWDAYQTGGGVYGASDAQSIRSITINVSTPEGSRVEPNKHQIAAYQFIRQSGERIVDAIANLLLERYPSLQSRYKDFLGPAVMETHMPTITSVSGFKSLIGLGSIHIHTTAKAGVAYVGLQLGCTWDVEHGLGVMMHLDRVVEFGGADTAILEWIAEDDVLN